MLINDTTGVYNESYYTGGIGTKFMKIRGDFGLMFGSGYLCINLQTMTKVSSAVVSGGYDLTYGDFINDTYFATSLKGGVIAIFNTSQMVNNF